MLEKAGFRDSCDSLASGGDGGRRWSNDGGNENAVSCEEFYISRHNPNRTFRRESVIASWRAVRREREMALGKRAVPDYPGGAPVRRTRSERAPTRIQRVQTPVKRTYSVLYRYDADCERVVKEYRCQTKPVNRQSTPLERPRVPLRCTSEPPASPAPKASKRPARRSLTALLTFKSRLLSIFAPRTS